MIACADEITESSREDEESDFWTADEDEEESEEEAESSDEEEGCEQEIDESIFIDKAKEPLYPGAPITVAEHVILILSFLLRFKVTGVVFSNVLTLISKHCIQPNFCTKTMHKFKKIFRNIHTPLIKHYYCTVCYTKLETCTTECMQCKNNMNLGHFIEIPIIEQLEKLYKVKGFKESLTYRVTREKKIKIIMKTYMTARSIKN